MTTVAGRCIYTVEVRYTYRQAGSHTYLHYTIRQCSRQQAKGSVYCWQHRKWFPEEAEA